MVFYGVGNTTFEVSFPGLTQQDVAEYLQAKKMPSEIRFSDDPETLDDSDQYWVEANKFVEEYNKLMVSYIRQSESAGERSLKNESNP